MNTLQRLAIIVLGLVFLTSAILKGLDPTAFAAQIFYLGVVRVPWMVWLIALGVIVTEALLSVALLLGLKLRSLTLPATVGVLTFFTTVMGWEWVFWNIPNCGCFGKYLPMTPAQALIKNLFLLGLAGYAWIDLQPISLSEPDAPSQTARSCNWRPLGRRLAWRIGLVVLWSIAVTGLAIVHAPKKKADNSPMMRTNSASGARPSGAGPFAGYSLLWNGKVTYDLSHGTYLVAMLSESCSHCAEDVASLNRLAADSGLPPVVGLMLGEDGEVRAFGERYQAHFPLQAMPVLEFLNLIGDTPPRFILARDDRQLTWWDGQVPTREAILAALQLPIGAGRP